MSKVWTSFIKLSDKEAKCKNCNKYVKSSGNTSNLTAHIKRCVQSQTTKPKNTLQFTQLPAIESDSSCDRLETSSSSCHIVRIQIELRVNLKRFEFE